VINIHSAEAKASERQRHTNNDARDTKEKRNDPR
jgi:hypothetical protein